MNRRVRTVATLLPIISLTLLLAGCPKRPMVPVVSAPPPVPAPAPPPPAPAPAPRRLRWHRPSWSRLARAPSAGAAEGVPAQRGAQADLLRLRQGGHQAR